MESNERRFLSKKQQKKILDRKAARGDSSVRSSKSRFLRGRHQEEILDRKVMRGDSERKVVRVDSQVGRSKR